MANFADDSAGDRRHDNCASLFQTYESFAISHARTMEALYDNLKPLNFSRDFLEMVSRAIPAAIAVLPVLGVYWSDWGSPERILETLEHLEQGRGLESAGKLTIRQDPAPQPSSSTWPIELR